MAKGRKTGGRRAGTPNKSTAEVKAYAQQFDKEAIDILMAIARNKKAHEKARVAAAILGLGDLTGMVVPPRLPARAGHGPHQRGSGPRPACPC